MNHQQQLPTLDAHVHILHKQGPSDLAHAGAALAVTLSLEEAAHGIGRTDPLVLWGVGCHPTEVDAQERFEIGTFKKLVERMPVVGEVGLDKRSEVPFEHQLKVFRDILDVVIDNPRIVSIHSNHATAEILGELQKRRILVPVLYWWNASNSRTRAAVDLGCYFSVNSKIASYSLFSKCVPIDRILLETDQGFEEPPSAIPGRIEQAERMVAAKYNLEPAALRWTTWQNFGKIVDRANISHFLTEKFVELLKVE